MSVSVLRIHGLTAIRIWMLANASDVTDSCAPHTPLRRRMLPSKFYIGNRRSWGIGSIFYFCKCINRAARIPRGRSENLSRPYAKNADHYAFSSKQSNNPVKFRAFLLFPIYLHVNCHIFLLHSGSDLLRIRLHDLALLADTNPSKPFKEIQYYSSLLPAV